MEEIPKKHKMEEDEQVPEDESPKKKQKKRKERTDKETRSEKKQKKISKEEKKDIKQKKSKKETKKPQESQKKKIEKPKISKRRKEKSVNAIMVGFESQPSVLDIALPDSLKELPTRDININISISGGNAHIISDSSTYESMRKQEYILRKLVYGHSLWVDKVGSRFNPHIGEIVAKYMIRSRNSHLLKRKKVTSATKLVLDTTDFNNIEKNLQDDILMAEKTVFFAPT